MKAILRRFRHDYFSAAGLIVREVVRLEWQRRTDIVTIPSQAMHLFTYWWLIPVVASAGQAW